MSENNKRYVYFVSYKYAGGFGRCDYAPPSPIESIEDIAYIEQALSDSHSNTFDQCCIDNFQLLRTEDI